MPGQRCQQQSLTIGNRKKEDEGILRELQSQNDCMSIHGVPSLEAATKRSSKHVGF